MKLTLNEAFELLEYTKTMTNKKMASVIQSLVADNISDWDAELIEVCRDILYLRTEIVRLCYSESYKTLYVYYRNEPKPYTMKKTYPNIKYVVTMNIDMLDSSIPTIWSEGRFL